MAHVGLRNGDISLNNLGHTVGKEITQNRNYQCDTHMNAFITKEDTRTHRPFFHRSKQFLNVLFHANLLLLGTRPNWFQIGE